ncbi:unnamed protein product [Symbiodinium sp. CCMP2592]|nr:unnamed protein product [Symbiodinium sp. CCMP2592]
MKAADVVLPREASPSRPARWIDPPAPGRTKGSESHGVFASAHAREMAAGPLLKAQQRIAHSTPRQKRCERTAAAKPFEHLQNGHGKAQHALVSRDFIVTAQVRNCHPPDSICATLQPSSNACS